MTATNPRRIFVDCGAHRGESIEMFCRRFPRADEFKLFCFEPNPELWPILRAINGVELIEKAVWTNDGPRDFWLGVHSQASTLRGDKVSLSLQKAPITVECIDFPGWLENAMRKASYAVVKLDVEGAEYSVLAAMSDSLLRQIDVLYVDFHGQKLGNFDMAEHDAAISRLERIGHPLRRWSPHHDVLELP